MARHVRLKEHDPEKAIKERVPDEREFAAYNGTIELKKYTLHIDANGFVRSRHAGQFKGAEKVVLLGDSVFECSFVDDGSRLCDLLNERSMETGGKFEFINAGYATATTLNSVVSFVAKVLPLRPKHLVLCADTFDVDCWNDQRSYWVPHPWYSPIVPAAPGYKRVPSASMNSPDYHVLVDGLVAMCRTAGINLHVMTKPICPESAWSASRQKYFDNKTRALRTYNEVVRAYAEKTAGCALVDIDRLCEFQWDDFYDANHLNAVGVKRAAEFFGTYFFSMLEPAPVKRTFAERLLERVMAPLRASAE